MRVAIIGGGLVGRLAAWAVMQSGHSSTIFDRMYEKVAKAPRGFVYMHEACGLPLRPQLVTVIEQGTAEEYTKKVYQGGPSAPTAGEVSFGKYGGVRECYDPGELLGILNGLQHGMVQEHNFVDLEEILNLLYEYDRLVFTLPINSFIKGNWPFRKGSVGAWPLDPGEEGMANFCVYNSSPEIPWHRSGAMFGWAFREFPAVVPGHQPIIKVIDGDKPPTYKNVLFTGRFGAWRKKQLSHESYTEVLNWLDA